MGKLKALWLDTLDSLWFIPALLTLGGAGLAILLVRLSGTVLAEFDPTTAWWVFGGTAEGAQGVLSAISGSIMTVTGVVFSVTIVALQLASSQFTPRVLRQFTSDRANQVVLGVFIGTFTYTLLVQRTLRNATDEMDRFVPNVAVTGAVVLALVSIGFLIFFINHAARSIQASVVIDSVAGDTMSVIRNLFPNRRDPGAVAPDGIAVPARDAEDGAVMHCRRAGYVQGIDTGRLRRLADEHGLFIRLEVETGAYVLPGEHVATVWPARGGADVCDEVLKSFVLGIERTPHQDVRLGVIELMDIAVKAMSPSVNDPTTALNAVDRLTELLLELSWREDGDLLHCHEDGRPLVLERRPVLASVVDLAFNQTRHYAAGNPSVSIRMIQSLSNCATLCPQSARAPFLEHLHAVHRTALLRIEDSGDRERVQNVYSAALRVQGAA